MSNSDIFSVVQWFVTILFIGIPFVPLTSTLFSSFFDKGYIFSKILGMAILSYLIFIVGILHILPFSQTTILFVVFICTFLFNLNIITKKDSGLLHLLKEKKFVFLFEEVLFFIGLFFWSYIRTFAPDIHGLEKFMDYGFINSILRSTYFPPKDMWFTPFSINYYYFGHIVTAILTKLSGIPANITFNLMVATVFSFCFTAAFSIGANLYTFLVKDASKLKIGISGILTAFLVSMSGNMHVLYTLFANYDVTHPKPFWQMAFAPQTFPNAYWYPNATRFIYNTIHEFPMYSWVVSDLHGHVLDIPFVLLTVALLLTFFFKPLRTVTHQSKESLVSKAKGYLLEREILTGFILAVMYMTNAWDGLIYLLLAAIVFSVKTISESHTKLNFNIKDFFTSETIQSILTSGIVLFVSFVCFSFPFSFFFKPFVSGVGILSAPDFLVQYGKIGPFLFEAHHTQHSPWWQLLILYGFFLFFVLSYVIFMFFTKQKKKVDLFIALLILLSLLLIFIPEVIYVKDIYPEHYRANTMFKLVFQAFMLLSIVSGFVITRILISVKKFLYQKFAFSLFFVLATLLLITVLSYPYFAITSYYNLQTRYSLDGTKYLQNIYPDDYKAIAWIQKHISGQPVILEAQGDSYTDYERISANTGLPTVLGWTVHEWLWRGTYDIPAPRIDEVKTLYETPDREKTKSLIKKYNIAYIYIGELEQQKYQVDKDKLLTLGKVVFSSNNTTIVKLTR